MKLREAVKRETPRRSYLGYNLNNVGACNYCVPGALNNYS